MQQSSSCPNYSPVLDADSIDAIIHAKHTQPHSILGMHLLENTQTPGLIVRAFLQNITLCWVLDVHNNQQYPLQRIHPTGLFEGIIPKKKIFNYQLVIKTNNNTIHHIHDPYSFLPVLSEEDLFLFNQGTHHRIYEKLGSHPITHQGIAGTSFAVWAPSAKRVSVVGDFNNWDGRYHPMRSMGSSGIFELFIPDLAPHTKYKYEIIGADNLLRIKTDPYAYFYESPPNNASITYDINHYTWNDQVWMETRAQKKWHQEPISIYEVHLGSWKRVIEDGNRPLTYRETAHQLVEYLQDMHFTHVEFMPLAEHPFSGSWGYQVTGFFAPTHRYGTPEDFMYMVDYLHQHNFGVIMDWVPAHFPKDIFALADFDGTHLYEHEDPKKGQHQDWGTLIFNYGRHEVLNFLIASALSWLDRFHIDGFRVDAVASMLYLDYSRKHDEWIPNAYGGRENLEALQCIRTINTLIHQYYPGVITIAEESTSWGGVSKPVHDGGLGFDFKWNMGWMHDMLQYFKQDPINRKFHHDKLTFGMLYQYSENFISVFSHDEVVHGKGSMIMKMGSWHMRDKAATLRALYAYMWLWPGKNTLFMGSEFGQTHEWHYDSSLDWHLLEFGDHASIQSVIRDLNKLYKKHSSLALKDHDPEGFQWLDIHDKDNSIISFLRIGNNPHDTLLVVSNFTPIIRYNYQLGVPHSGYWEEILNTQSSIYDGSNDGNLGGLHTQPHLAHHKNQCIYLTLPALSTLVFQYKEEKIIPHT
jgi:1,4-alpha-glucan branching enzyme